MAGLLLITHGTLGADMLDTVREILCGCPLPAETLAIDSDADTDALYQAASDLCTRLDDGDGVLVLTDLMGASPSNRVSVLLEHFNAVMVTGANLAMLLCVWANREMPLGQLARKAVDCGRRSVKIFQA